MDKATFDDSLERFCQVLRGAGQNNLLASSVFVRGSAGRLRLVVPAEMFNVIDVADLRRKIAEELGRYSEAVPENLVKDTDDPVVDRMHLALPERVGEDGVIVRVIDQRSKGQDWLIRPTEHGGAELPPRLVFWSLKGGVGRTTALTVLAASLARRGHNLLIVDLDLEAPGVGDQLLQEEDKPTFGVLDYLVEGGIGNLDLGVVTADIVGTSTLVEGSGLIQVCPAAGRKTYEHPSGFVGKLFRSYASISRDQVEQSFAQRITQLINTLCQQRTYDAVLIDARAGLSESTAAAVLSLGGDVLMFGHDTPQTFNGYRYALAHLSRFAIEGDGDWRLKLKMVHAKASPLPAAQEAFRDKAFELFSQWIYDESDEFSFSLTDEEAPHSPCVVLDDSNFRDFNPIENPALLFSPITQATFGGFVDFALERMRLKA